MKYHQVLYPKPLIKMLRERLPGTQPFSFMFMKKFLIFILFSLLLIISEYFLLNEWLSHKRMTVLLLSLLGTILCIYGAYKFFKKYILAVKH